MKNEYLMDYHFRKVARIAQGLSLAFLLAVLLLLAGCGGSNDTGSSQTSAAPASPVTTNTLTLSQAQQQSGYHLLSIPSSLTGYTLTKVTAVDAAGHQEYILNYSMGKNTIIITQGQEASISSGSPKVSLRGTTATVLSVNGHTTLLWTEKGVSRTISGALSSAQMIALAKALV